jgi:parallel beta-helix repeat protein
LKGVGGAVTFNVMSGNYNEHIVLYNIPGASASNTVTFQAATGNAADATLYFFATAAESNYVVRMYNADYIHFHKISLRSNNSVGAQYGRVFYFSGSTENFTLDSCIVHGTPSASNSVNYTVIYITNNIMDSITINGNTFNDGGSVIYLDGNDASFLSANTVITNNIFNNPDNAGIFLQYHDYPVVRDNTINNTANIGIQINYGYGNLEVTNNQITGATDYGIYLYHCVGGTGFPGGPGLVANNMLQCRGGNGIDLYTCSNQNVYYNSVNMTVAGSYGYYGYSNTTNVVVQNNNFANTGGSYAVYFGNASGATTMDYNNLYVVGNFVGLYGSTATVDLESWRTTSGKDAHSVSYYPGFVSGTDLHTASPWLNGRGTPFGDVTEDIDGNARDGSTPDIGADEYDPEPGSMTPLSGSYTIGTGGTYTTFKSAVEDLQLKGVGGAVTFNVMSGTYNEHITLYNVPGASRNNAITFQSQNGNPSGTILYYPATAADSNYVVRMYQADYFVFKDLTLRANTAISSDYGRIFNISGNVDYLRLEGNILDGTPASSSNGAFTVINVNQAVLRSLNIIDNIFNDGGYVLYLDGNGTNFPCDSTVISGNIFNNPDYSGMYLQYHDAPVITRNTIVNPTNRGIELNNCTNGVQITKNKLYNCGNIGIYLNACTGGVSGSFLPGLIANNFVHGRGNSYGIDIYNCANQKIYNNSVNMTGSSSSAYYGYGNATNVQVMNNIFANSGGGYAVNFGSTNGASAMDYNDHFTTGNFLCRLVNTNIADLAAWQTSSSKDAFSISVNPQFYSTTNLHVYSALLDSTGTPLSEVTDDYDGEPRNPVRPDIGADEFSLIVQAVGDMENGWNMISLPLMVSDNRKTTLYPNAGSDAFEYLPGGYAAEDTINIGVGYWLKYSGNQQNAISGYPILNDTIAVLTGWNLIGTIAFPIPASAIVTSTPVISDYFAYSGTSGYISGDTLEPGKAYWVKTTAAGTFILDVNNTKLKHAAVSPSATIVDQLNRLSFGPAGSSGSDHNGTKLYFGTAREKEINMDRYSLPPLPPEGVTDVRFASGRFVELLDGECVQAVNIPISIQGNNVTLKLSWEMKQQSGFTFNFVEREGEKIVLKQSLTASGSLIIVPKENYSFAIESEPLPSKIMLYQNYPNPFNPVTTIRFALPTASQVTLKVFDILGQEVATLVDELRSAGEHSITFDASGIASGIYFYQLKTGNFIVSKKMMILR